METALQAELVKLDPCTLLTDLNIRDDVRLDKDFVASIKERGVLVPIVGVRTANGDVRVRLGHRRTLAAVAAELESVPVHVVGDESTDDAAQIARLIDQFAENEHRAGLTQAELSGIASDTTFDSRENPLPAGFALCLLTSRRC